MKMKETVSKYRIVYEEMKKEIVSGRMAQGEKMPSELQLMERYGFSRQTIRKALEELAKDGYVQKVQGSGSFVKSSRTGEKNSKTIMFIALFAQHYFFSQYIAGVESVLKENGYALNVSFSDNRPEDEARCLEDAIEKGYAGILLVPARSACIYANLYLYKKIRQLRIPCITLGGQLPYSGFPCVIMDDYEGGKMAAKYLIDKGHTRIACIMNRTECSGCMRYAGYQSALMEAGIKEEPGWAQWYEYETFREFLENGELTERCLSKVTSVFCFNDEMALAIIELLKKQGIRVPEDMSVIGYDDSYMCMFGEKKLTSIRQEPVEQGKRAAVNLLRLIKNPNSGADSFFGPSVVERETVRDFKCTN